MPSEKLGSQGTPEEIAKAEKMLSYDQQRDLCQINERAEDSFYYHQKFGDMSRDEVKKKIRSNLDNGIMNVKSGWYRDREIDPQFFTAEAKNWLTWLNEHGPAYSLEELKSLNLKEEDFIPQKGKPFFIVFHGQIFLKIPNRLKYPGVHPDPDPEEHHSDTSEKPEKFNYVCSPEFTSRYFFSCKYKDLPEWLRKKFEEDDKMWWEAVNATAEYKEGKFGPSFDRVSF